MTSISSLVDRLRSHKNCTCVDFRGEDPTCIYCSAASEIERLQQENEILATRQWQPIETAPRDGTQVDLWCVPPLGKAVRVPDCWFSGGKWWRYSENGDDQCREEVANAIYWMRLAPARRPPETAEGGER